MCWGSKLKRTERILEQTPAIRRVFADDKSRCPLPNLTWQDISVLESVNNGLKPVADLTDVLAGETYVTVSAVTPALQHTCRVLTETDDDTQLSKKIKTGILEELDAKYDNHATQKLIRISTLLDHCYRGGFNLNELEQTKTEVLDAIIQCHRMKNLENTEEQKASTSAQEVPSKKKKNTLSDLLGKTKKPPTSEAERVAAELVAYLLEDVIDGEENPLAWWKNNESRFPLMSLVT
ncbi:zinc finger BED domain-containing protein 4-like isoform X2 [Amia ocellicauda]